MITELLDEFQFSEPCRETVDALVAFGILGCKVSDTPVATQRVVVEVVCNFKIGIAQKNEVAGANIRVLKSPVDPVNLVEGYCPTL